LETIIQEAKTRFVDDGMRYIYHINGDSVALQFNSIYQVVAATLDGLNYRSVEELTPKEKVCNNVLELISLFFSESLIVISPFLFFFIELVIWKEILAKLTFLNCIIAVIARQYPKHFFRLETDYFSVPLAGLGGSCEEGSV
jgi:hypothetical protein